MAKGAEFAAPSTDDSLIEAVHFLKATFPKGKPLGHLSLLTAVILIRNRVSSMRRPCFASTQREGEAPGLTRPPSCRRSDTQGWRMAICGLPDMSQRRLRQITPRSEPRASESTQDLHNP